MLRESTHADAKATIVIGGAHRVRIYVRIRLDVRLREDRICIEDEGDDGEMEKILSTEIKIESEKEMDSKSARI